jgi:formate hydrogenlyase subunit 6/NADH:ubiquinone oxidoreductase subunit I
LCEKICPWDAITMVPPQEAPAMPAALSSPISL